MLIVFRSLSWLEPPFAVSIFVLSIVPEVALEALRTRKHPQRVVLAVILLIAAFIASSLFLAWNCVLLWRNESTLEFFDNRFASIRVGSMPARWFS